MVLVSKLLFLMMAQVSISVGAKRVRSVEDDDDDVVVDLLKKRLKESKPWSSLLSGDTLFDLGRGLSVAGADAGEEVWNLYGWIGRREEQAFFASFKSFSMFNNSNAEPDDVARKLTRAYALHWGVIDTLKEKHYCFSDCDYRGANILLGLMAQKPGTYAENSVLGEAVAEQLHLNNFVLPDKVGAKTFSSVQGIVQLQFGNSLFKCDLQKGGKMTFSLHLEGNSNGFAGDEDIQATLDVTFTVSAHPVLDGNESGCVDLGSWENGIFRYFVPSCRVTSVYGKILDGQNPLYIESKNGSVWLEHEISQVRPNTLQEARILRELSMKQLHAPQYVERCCLTLIDSNDEYAISASRVVDMDSGKTIKAVALVQRGKEKPIVYSALFNHDKSKQYRSASTGILFSTKWFLKLQSETERSTIELQISATFQKQEFVSMLASPSYWNGIVNVEGVVQSEGEQVESVSGMGFLKCYGKRNLKETASFFRTLRSSSILPLEKERLFRTTFDEILTEPQVISSLSSISVILQMQGFCLSQTQKYVLSVFFATYNIIYHSCDVKTIEQALEWCYGKWMGFVSLSSISYSTVFIRAFGLQELRHALMCSGYKQVLDKFHNCLCIDIVNPSSTGFLSNSCSNCVVPDIPNTGTESSALDVAAATAAFHGTFDEGKSLNTGSLRLLYLCEGAPFFWRYQQSLQKVSISLFIESKTKTLKLEQSSFLMNYSLELPLNGREIEWECMGRGRMISKAVLLSEGIGIYLETQVHHGVERIWYSVDNTGDRKMLKESIYFFAQLGDKAPTTCLVRNYSLRN